MTNTNNTDGTNQAYAYGQGAPGTPRERALVVLRALQSAKLTTLGTRALARHLGEKPSVVVELLVEMRREGWVERPYTISEAPADRTYKITTLGMEVLVGADPKETARIALSLTPSERRVLALMLARKSDRAIRSAMQLGERELREIVSELQLKLGTAPNRETIAQRARYLGISYAVDVDGHEYIRSVS